jgi:hypothetical protein
MPFIIFQTIDNNQQIEVMYDDLQGKQKLFIGTQQEFSIVSDIDLFLEQQSQPNQATLPTASS